MSEAQQDTTLSPNTYRSGVRFLRILVLLQACIVIFLLGVLIYNLQYGEPQDGYYAVSSKSNPRRLIGLQTPYLNRTAVETWAATAVTSVMTFGFNDIEEKFAENRKFFTVDGWRSFNTAMDAGGFRDIIINNQQIVTSIVMSTPVIVWYGNNMGRFVWIVQAPIAMTIRAGGKSVTRNVTVRLTLVRLPTAENPMGIGIDNWNS